MNGRNKDGLQHMILETKAVLKQLNLSIVHDEH